MAGMMTLDAFRLKLMNSCLKKERISEINADASQLGPNCKVFKGGSFFENQEK
jgi:hypothetical protein